MSNPATRNIEAYFGNTYGLVYVFENSAGAAFDIASNFSTLSLKIFTKNNEASPLVELDLDSGFTISDTNRLTGEITAAQNETLFGSPIKYYQMTVTYNGDTETILKGIYVVNRAQSGSANDTALTLTVSLAPLEVSVSVADNAFLALQAKNETQEIVSQVSPSRAGISYATKVDMDNDTTQINGTTGIVANDTAANNGFYRWDDAGNAWVKRDNFYVSVVDPLDETEAVNGKAVADWSQERFIYKNLINSHIKRGIVGEESDSLNYMTYSGSLSQLENNVFDYKGSMLNIYKEAQFANVRWYVDNLVSGEKYTIGFEAKTDQAITLLFRVMTTTDSIVSSKSVSVNGLTQQFITFTCPSETTKLYFQIFSSASLLDKEVLIGRVGLINEELVSFDFNKVIEFDFIEYDEFIRDYNGFSFKNNSGNFSWSATTIPFSTVVSNNFNYNGYSTRIESALRNNFYLGVDKLESKPLIKGHFVFELYSAEKITFDARVYYKSSVEEILLTDVEITHPAGKTLTYSISFECPNTDYETLRLRFFDVASSIDNKTFEFGRIQLYDSPTANVELGSLQNKGVSLNNFESFNSIVFLGDSLTADGYGTLVANDLNVTAITEGFSGEKSFQIAKRYIEDDSLHEFPLVIWVGRNNINDDSFIEDVIRDISKIVSTLNNENYIVLGVTTGNYADERKGGSRYLKNIELLENLSSIYGGRFINALSAIYNTYNYGGVELTASFTQPSVSANVSVSVNDTSFFNVAEEIRIGKFNLADRYEVVSIESLTAFTLKLLESERVAVGGTVQNESFSGGSAGYTASNNLLVVKNQDWIDRNDEIIPSSLRYDLIHLNEVGRQVLANEVVSYINYVFK